MAGGSPDEGEARPGRREPTDADVQRQWEQITASLSDLAGLGEEGTDTPRSPRPRTPRTPGEPAGRGEPDGPAGPGDLGGPGEPDGPDGPDGPGASTSSPMPGDGSGQDRRPPSSTLGGPPRIGDLPRSTPGAGGAGPRDYEPPEEEDEGYTPPEPPPIGATDPLPTLAWLLALGGPILTVLLLIFWTGAPGWLYLSAVAASLAGWLVLFWRMPRGRRDSDDDNGAVL